MHGAVEGLDLDALTHRVDGTANSISWLVWHLTRVQDDHVAEVAGTEQVWTADGGRSGSGCRSTTARSATGRAATRSGRCGPGPTCCFGYHDAVHARTLQYGRRPRRGRPGPRRRPPLGPSVTLGVRLVSVADDDMQHAGQAAFVRGIVERS